MKYGIKRNTYISGEINTKKDLFNTIRKLTNDGYFFEIRNGFDAKGRAFYMVL